MYPETYVVFKEGICLSFLVHVSLILGLLTYSR